MLISLSFFRKAVKDREKSLKNKKEGYSLVESTNAGMCLGMSSGLLVVAYLFLLLELLVLFYSLVIAVKCSTGHERVVHIVLAMTFTLPYSLFMLLFNKCASPTLANL